MPLPPPRLTQECGDQLVEKRKKPKQEMHLWGPIRGLYQARGGPANNTGGDDWLIKAAVVSGGQEVKGHQERLLCVQWNLLLNTEEQESG